jgi:two-component system NtrC family sensor kinase
MPEKPKDRILVVDSDPVVSDFLSRQALIAAGYKVKAVESATEAISSVSDAPPDAIIANLHLPGLSGKDMMVALSAQGHDIPVVIVAQKGSESDIVQAFRLGAADYLLWPVREAEVVAVMERVLKQVHARRERELLDHQLERTNRELKQRVNELTTMYGIGKAVTSITDQTLLFENILSAASNVTRVDVSWLLLREESSSAFHLVAHQNLPPSLSCYLNQPWDDGISSLVAISGESLSIHGSALERFKVNSLGKSALVVPVKAQKQVIGLLAAMRKKPMPFSDGEQNLLEAVTDYASISLVNARLFRAVEERARALESKSDDAPAHALQALRSELQIPLEKALSAFEVLSKMRLKKDQSEAMDQMEGALHDMLRAINQAEKIAAQIPKKR